MSDSGDRELDKRRELEAEREHYAADTPTSKVEALREQIKPLIRRWGLLDDTEAEEALNDVIKAFATFLESLGSQAETFSKDGKPLSDTNSIESVPVSALHQVVTALRGGNSVRNGGQG